MSIFSHNTCIFIKNAIFLLKGVIFRQRNADVRDRKVYSAVFVPFYEMKKVIETVNPKDDKENVRNITWR